MYEHITHWCFNFEIPSSGHADLHIFAQRFCPNFDVFLPRSQNTHNVNHNVTILNMNEYGNRSLWATKGIYSSVDFSPNMQKVSYSVTYVLQTPRLNSAILNWIIIGNCYYANVIGELGLYNATYREFENTCRRTVAILSSHVDCCVSRLRCFYIHLPRIKYSRDRKSYPNIRASWVLRTSSFDSTNIFSVIKNPENSVSNTNCVSRNLFYKRQ